METIQEKAVRMFWELEEEQNLVAGDLEIVNQRETGKCLDVIVLNNKPVLTYNEYYVRTFETYETVEEAVNSIPEKHLLKIEEE